MPDILIHVVVAYVVATTLSWRYEWLTPRLVTVAMLGATVPDVTKIALVVPDWQIEALLGIPFSWQAIHTAGGALVAVTIGSLLTDTEHRRRVFALLLLGASSHLFLDALLLKASGHSFAVFWPLTAYQPPTPGLYVSSDWWPAVVSGVVAIVVWSLRYQRT